MPGRSEGRVVDYNKLKIGPFNQVSVYPPKSFDSGGKKCIIERTILSLMADEILEQPAETAEMRSVLSGRFRLNLLPQRRLPPPESDSPRHPFLHRSGATARDSGTADLTDADLTGSTAAASDETGFPTGPNAGSRNNVAADREDDRRSRIGRTAPTARIDTARSDKGDRSETEDQAGRPESGDEERSNVASVLNVASV